jgi:hypothetical protein
MHSEWLILLEKYGLKGLINSRGQDLVNKELIIRLLEKLMLPEEMAIVHIPGHQ